MIDEFISWFLKLKSSQYLSFDPLGKDEIPPAPQKPIHLYIHIPYCVKLCPYCSFHRVAFCESDAKKYFEALRKELSIYSDNGFLFDGVYMGGGTPTVMMNELQKTLEHTNKLFSPKDISVETNPDRLEPEILKTLASNGVGRVSVGVQTFNNELLKTVDRYEKYGSGEQIKDKIKKVLGIVKALNVDMIYNFPIQTDEQIIADIETINEIKPDQVTFYPLMVSDLTRSDMEAIMGPHSFKKEKKFYGHITSRLDSVYHPSSAWCFSRKSGDLIDEYIITSQEYIGAGSGAFGLVGGAIYANTFSIPKYVKNLSNGHLAIHAKKRFSKLEMARYSFLMDLFGLRLDRKKFREKFGRDIRFELPLETTFFNLIGAIKSDKDFFQLTQKGQYYWVIMMREFFTGVDNFRDISRSTAG